MLGYFSCRHHQHPEYPAIYPSQPSERHFTVGIRHGNCDKQTGGTGPGKYPLQSELSVRESCHLEAWPFTSEATALQS